MDLKKNEVAIPFFARFRTRVDLLILLVFIPALGLTVYTNFLQRQTEKQRIKDGTVAMARLAAANEEGYAHNAQQLLATLAEFAFMVQGTNRPFSEINFTHLRKLAPDYLDFGLIETNGTLFCSTIITNDTPDFSKLDFFQRAVRTKRFSIGAFESNGVSPRATLDFAQPVFDHKGRLVRVIYAALDLGLLGRMAPTVPFPPGASLTVFDRRGVALARYPNPDQWVGKLLSDYPLFQAIQEQKGAAFEGPGLDNVKRLFAVAPVSDGSGHALYVTTGIPTSISFAHANQSLVRGIVALSIIAILALVAAHAYAKYSFLRPMAELVTAAQHVTEGDFTYRTSIPANRGELSLLGHHLNQMAANLQQRQAQLQAATEEVTRMNTHLEQRVNERTIQLEDVNRELEAFSFSVSHDLRAPLRHITGFVDVIREDQENKLSEGSARSLKIILDSTRQMGRLIADLLAFSRTSRATMAVGPVSNNQLVREAIDEVSLGLGTRQIQWDIANLPEVSADRALLRQVWLNLLSNAVKYTGFRERAEIQLGFRETEKEFEFFVRDNGAGFDMRYAHKLFGVFQRLHRADQFEGTGIGLANVRRIIRRHGGRTWAEGKVEEGATFYFTIPRPPPA